MNSVTFYQYVKLGMNLEYLRGIASISIIPATSLVAFPRVMDNQPETRFRVQMVVNTLKAILAQLEDLELTESRTAAAVWEPMLKEMEEALASTPQPQTITLRDHFAEQLVAHANNVSLAVKEETSKRVGGWRAGE